MLSTKNLDQPKWYTPKQVEFILERKYELICSVRNLYKLLRDSAIIDENNKPLSPYDDGRFIDTEPVSIDSPYTGKFKRNHNKIFINKEFLPVILKLIPKSAEIKYPFKGNEFIL